MRQESYAEILETLWRSGMWCCVNDLENLGGLYVFAANEDTSSCGVGGLNPQRVTNGIL